MRQLLRLAALAVLVAAAHAVEAGGQRPIPPLPEKQATVHDQLAADRQWLERAGPRGIGMGFACAQFIPRGLGQGKRGIRLYVVERRAVARAERLRRRVRSAARTKVEIIGRRYRATTMRRIRREAFALWEALPPEHAHVFGRALVTFSPCPVVRMAVAPPAQTSAETERRLAALRDRYGRDRVWILRTGPATPG
jgi:hypothetical protein